MKKRKTVLLFLLLPLFCALVIVSVCLLSGCNRGGAGADGKSAYQIWLDEGHTGSQSDFLEWLKGEDGTGADGKSAYEIWLDNGHIGTEADFLNWLKADGGASEGGNNTDNEWNISANVCATVIKNGENFTLRISGSGNMKSWSKAQDLPWYSVGDKIKEIIIGEKVTSIGDYAFSNTAVTSLVIPESVKSVGSYALPANATVYYTEQTEIQSSQNSGVALYLYSEDVPETYDRHWTSWGSTGNITDEPMKEPLRYWHYGENGEIAVWEKIKVLFIGNSFTFYYQMPKQFDAIAENLGYYVETYSIAQPSQTLEEHAKASSASGKQLDDLLKKVNDFDYVVLQEQSTRPYTDYEKFFNGVKALKEKIEATQNHAKIYLYETWGSPASAGNTFEEIAEMEQKLYEAYTRAASDLQLNVTYVGRAFTFIKGETDLNLYTGDNRHPGPVGSHLSACVHVANMLGGDVRNSTVVGEDLEVIPSEGGTAQKLNLTNEQCEVLRAAAYTVVFGGENERQTYTVKLWYNGATVDEISAFAGYGVTLPSCTVAVGEKFGGWKLETGDKLYAADTRISYAEISGNIKDGVVNLYAKSYETVIAVWGRWITEDNLQKVMQGFKKYCADNGLNYDKVGYIYYVGKIQNADPYFAIADFTKKAEQDDVDIIFPCGDNITNASQSKVADMVEEYVKIDATIEGNSTRYVARLNDKELTLAFYNYMASDEAKVILNGLN